MAPEIQAQRETQEQSIKARKTELFEEEVRDGEGGPVRPFRAYLETTPAAPMSLGLKAGLWSAGVVVGLVFLAAIAGRKTQAKVPEGLVVPAAGPLLAKVPPPAAPLPAIAPNKEEKPKGAAKPEDKKDKDKNKNKDKKPKNNKSKNNKKPKTEAVAKAGPPKDEAPKPAPSGPEATANTPTPKPDNAASPTAAAPATTPKPGAPTGEAATRPNDSAKPGTTAPSDPKTAQANAQPSANDATPKEPPKKKVTTGLFRKKPAYNPAYPKREPVKKKDAMPNPSDSSSSTTPSP